LVEIHIMDGSVNDSQQLRIVRVNVDQVLEILSAAMTLGFWIMVRPVKTPQPGTPK